MGPRHSSAYREEPGQKDTTQREECGQLGKSQLSTDEDNVYLEG